MIIEACQKKKHSKPHLRLLFITSHRRTQGREMSGTVQPLWYDSNRWRVLSAHYTRDGKWHVHSKAKSRAGIAGHRRQETMMNLIEAERDKEESVKYRLERKSKKRTVIPIWPATGSYSIIKAFTSHVYRIVVVVCIVDVASRESKGRKEEIQKGHISVENPPTWSVLKWIRQVIQDTQSRLVASVYVNGNLKLHLNCSPTFRAES